MKRFWFLKIAVFVVAGIFVFGTTSMYLWNWLVPDLFHGPVITFWQALGLVVLSRILFRGFFGMGGRHGWGGHRWGRHWKERWEKMTPEQREEMRKRWEGRCGGRWRSTEQTKAPAV